ncbi:hypothetical protein [Lysobacter gummosus]|uniref:hypothetical protein n=1 Tax=Lysobacter gummosus TaxID=262324 RepID=UPI00362E3FE3
MARAIRPKTNLVGILVRAGTPSTHRPRRTTRPSPSPSRMARRTCTRSAATATSTRDSCLAS